MLPIGPLMIEHRLIERVIEDVGVELSRLRAGTAPDPSYLATVIDFLRTYADRTHHGKEEDILFAELAEKQLEPALEGIMQTLLEDHRVARRATGRLAEAVAALSRADEGVAAIIEGSLAELVALYPVHIAMEDKQFFKPAMGYFTRHEQDGMLQRFREFDSSLIHERYRRVVETMAQRRPIPTP